MKDIKPSEEFVKELHDNEPSATGGNSNPQVISQQQSVAPANQAPSPQPAQSASLLQTNPTIPNAGTQTPNASQPILDTSTPLVGSQMAQEKVKMPIGIYLIAGWALVSIILSLFDTSEASNIFAGDMVLNLCVGVALLFRLEGARKTMIWLCGITIVLSIALILLTALLVNVMDQKTEKYNALVNQYKQSYALTDVQKKELSDQKAEINALVVKVGKRAKVSYAIRGVTVIIASASIFYLTRPKVKKVFYSLPST